MNILQRNNLFQYVLAPSRWFLQTRHFLITLTGIHVLWLAAIGLTGANTNWDKLLFLIFFSILAGAAVVLLPPSLVAKLALIEEWLLQKEKRVVLLLGLAGLTIGIFYAVNQRIWPNEKPMFAAAKILSTEGVMGIAPTFSKISMLGYQHPPLVPLMDGFTVKLLGADLFYLRLVSVLFLAGTLITTYLLGRDLYDRKTGLLASLLMLSFPLTIRLGSAALMDIQLTFFFSLALLLSIRMLRKPSYGLAAVLGIVIGLGLLTKYLMVLFYGVLVGYAIFSPSVRRLKRYFATAILVSFCVFGVWVSYAYQSGLLSGQIQRILNYSGIYHLVGDIGGEGNPAAVDAQPTDQEYDTDLIQVSILKLGLESIFTRLPSSLGVHFVPLLLLGGIYLLRRRTQSDRFVLVWIGLVAIVLLFTLPGHRYFLCTFPAMAIVIARFFHRHPEMTNRAVILSLLFLAAAMFLYVDWVREGNLFVTPIP